MLRRSILSFRAVLGGAFLAILTAGCSGGDWGDDGFGDPPEDDGPPSPPSDPPPTGNKWVGVETTNDCGRTTLEYILVDEVCGMTEDPGYMAAFHAPIMRDGAVVADHLYAVDATNLWVIRADDPGRMDRSALVAGLGQPMSVAAHGGDLVVASGDRGLLVLDASLPEDPRVIAELNLEGPALDVYLEGDRAFVAMGAAGVAVIDLTDEGPVLVKTLDVAGVAAAVAARGGVAYVAACGAVVTVDIETGETLSQIWRPDSMSAEGVLVAPAKDIELVGDVAFVAAGRFGAVAIDIADPSQPSLIGNCTLPNEASFYASGVRAHDGRLFVAGGEYGILPVDVADPRAACSVNIPPTLPPPPADGGECTSEPPWEIVPWQDTWAPPPVPPEGRDPLQTLPMDGRIFAFGDATRIGVRAIDVRDPASLETKLGRYAEPRLTEGIASQGRRVLVTGKAGALYELDAEGALQKIAEVPEAKLSRAAAFFGDGRWVTGGLDVLTGGGALYVQGFAPIAMPKPIWAGGIAAKASTVYIPLEAGIFAMDLDGSSVSFPTSRYGLLPPTIAVGSDHLVVAFPEWSSTLRVDGASVSALGGLELFASGELGDATRWQKALPRRTVLTGDLGVVEVASLAGDAGITVHGADLVPRFATLPPGDYIAAAMHGDRVFAIAVDRGRYRSQLVTIAIQDGTPSVVDTYSFIGAATSAAASEGHLFIADGDRGLRIFDIEEGELENGRVVDLSFEVSP